MTEIAFRKCYPEHVLLIDIQRGQQIEHANVVLGGGEIAAHGVSQSAWLDNRCLWAGGVFEKWSEVGFGWALFGKGCYPHMAAITACAKAMITEAPYKRVEVTVDPDYDAGHRWAKALGLTLEAARLRCYGPDGRDMALYAHWREST